MRRATWVQIQPDGTAPPARKMHALGLLPAAPGRPAAAIVFGGERDSGLLDDLWLLQLPKAGGAGGADGQPEQQAGGADGAARWLQLRMKGAPAPRFGHALVGAWPARSCRKQRVCGVCTGGLC